MLISRAIMDEMERTLARVLGDRHEWRELLAIGEREATWVTPSERLSVVAEDPSDNRFLECAVEGRADYLVSGDAHLLNLGEFRGVKILTPRAFLDILAA